MTINGSALKTLVLLCSDSIQANKHEIDAMNVFPVPDGDTGTNMSFAMIAAAREASKLPDESSISDVAKAASFGALRGARGNSGVILSQILRGFAKGLDGLETAGIKELSAAFTKASETAYKAVMRPKEGTILTVAREFAEKAAELAESSDDMITFLREALGHATAVLQRTKEMLPALKQADVVDAGGQGYICMLNACVAYLSGDSELIPRIGHIEIEEIGTSGGVAGHIVAADSDIVFGYCTEFFINREQGGVFGEQDEVDMKLFLDGIGDSVVLVSDDGIMKVHVHSNNPGNILEKALKLGYLSNIKIENMRLQHNEQISFEINKLPKKVGFVAVSAGAGFDEMFRSFGADRIVTGGQSMNPSAEDFVAAFDGMKAERIIVLPNNKNIILAAEQAAFLNAEKDPNLEIRVLETTSIPEGLNALVCYSGEDDSADFDFDQAAAGMQEGADCVTTGQITRAVRDSAADGLSINEGDVIGIIDGHIVTAGQDVLECAKHLADTMIPQKELFSVFYGEGGTEEEAAAIADYVDEHYPFAEVEVHHGGQPVYSYTFSAL